MFYGNNNEAYKILQDFIQFHNEFQQKHKALESLPSFISLLALLHKSAIYSLEKEYRIIAVCRFDEYNYKIDNRYTGIVSKSLNHTIK